MRKVLVYWTCNRIAKRKIQKRFNLVEHTSVNGETECTVHEADWELFKETSKRGFFKIRNKTYKMTSFRTSKQPRNGYLFSF